MPCSPKQQQQKRRRVGLVAIAAASSYQLLLPQTAVDRDRGLAFAGTDGERQMVMLLVLALTTLLFIGAVVARRSGRNKRVCEKLVTKWRELSANNGGVVDRKEFEAGVKRIFTGNNEIGETETSYLYGLIQRLDSTAEEQIDEVELQTGLKKVMSLIGQKDVETVDDMREVLLKLANAASSEESENAEAIENEVKKEMSSKSMVDMDEHAPEHQNSGHEHRESSTKAADAADEANENPPEKTETELPLDQAGLEYEAENPEGEHQDQDAAP